MERDALAALVDSGMTIREMATHLGVSYSTVRYWLRRHDLAPPRARRLAASEPARRAGLDETVVECPRHGFVVHVARERGLRCTVCRAEAVSKRRRLVKATLVAEAGGCCVLCGYDRYVGALHFHHRDPAAKSFSIAAEGGDALARASTRRSREMRPRVRELSCRGGGGRRYYCASGPCR